MPNLIDHADSVRTGEELPVTTLAPYLLAHIPGSCGPLIVHQFPSGHSNLTYMLTMGDREMILRRPPFGSKVKTAHDMGREYRVLSKLHAAYREAPHVLLYCEDEAVLGAPFYLMDPIRGIILRKDPPAELKFTAEIAKRLSESFIDNLARLHSLDYHAVGLGDLGKPQGYLERQVRGWIERYHASETHQLPQIEPVSEWLRKHLPATSDAALIHNDYKYDNMVLDPADITRIVGVLDWEMSTIGDPLTDLGTALAYWVDADDSEELQRVRWSPSSYPGSFTRAQLVARYAQATGRDVSSMPYYLAFARFKVGVILQQIYYRYQMGLTRDERFALLPEKIRVLMQAALQAIETGSL